MHILFIHNEADIQEEIEDYLLLHKQQALFAMTTEQAIRHLNTHEIGLAVLSIKSLYDAGILKYINEHYQNIEVLILANQEFDEIISVFNKGRYQLLRQPFHLSELKDNIINSSKCLDR